MALFLSLAVSFTSVVPAGAAVTDPENQSQTVTETEETKSQDAASQDVANQDAANQNAVGQNVEASEPQFAASLLAAEADKVYCTIRIEESGDRFYMYRLGNGEFVDKWFHKNIEGLTSSDYYETAQSVTTGVWERYAEDSDIPLELTAGLYTLASEPSFEIWLSETGVPVVSDWIVEDGKYYYINELGQIDENVKGKQTYKGETIWVQDDHTLFKNGYKDLPGEDRDHVIRLHFDNNGFMAKEEIVMNSKWMRNSRGFWWQYADGTYPENEWKEINGQRYYFGLYGYMATGWQKLDGKWYYFGNDGAARKYWQKVGRYWFYFDPVSNIMQDGWFRSYDKWYYLTPGVGNMVEGWKQIDGKWFYLNPGNGAMLEGWQKLGKYWFYLNPGTGTMRTGWFKENNKWFYLRSNGSMVTDWQKLGRNWFYFDKVTGVMAEGWRQIDGKWFYLVPGVGNMQIGWRKIGVNTFYFCGNGVMATNYWIDHHYIGSNGAMVKDWQYINGYKLFFDEDGVLDQNVTDKVSGPYKLRVNRTRCMITVLAKDGDRGWTIPVKSMTCSVGLPATPTPTGTYTIGQKDRWHILMGPSWGQYTAHVVNGIFIHSVAGNKPEVNNLDSFQYNRLGSPASHGCIRLCVRDARWIYNNIPSGTSITIGDDYYEPFDKEALPKLPNGSNLVDPTQDIYE